MRELVDGVLHATDVLQLAARVTVHQLQAVEHVLLAQDLHGFEDFGGEQAELRLVAGRFTPFARAFTRQLDAHADARAHVVLLGDPQDGRQLAEVLHHRDDGAAELGGDDHRFEVTVVLETVADDQALGRVSGHGHDREQLRLAAHLETEAEGLAVAVHLFDHQALLVHLDREHRGVAVLVFVLGDRLRERVVQMLEAVREDVGKANHHRRREFTLLEALHDLEQVDFALAVHVRPNDEVAGFVHAEVALAPGVDLVELGCVLD